NRPHELEFALRQSECNYLISGERFKDGDYAPMLNELMPELIDANPGGDLHAGKFPHLRRVVFLAEQSPPGTLPWSGLLSLADQITAAQLAVRQATLDFD